MRTPQTYRGYSIEQERDGTFSVYSLTNSMYDCHNGFASVEIAMTFIDRRVSA